MKISPVVLIIAAALLPLAAMAKPAHKAADPKHDRHAPIEVTSDTLEVKQKENRAIFTGHVVAIQGDTRLKADVMTVYYENKGDKGQGKPGDKAKPAETAAAPTPDDSAIRKIEASGNVFLSTPRETASGDVGIYQPQEHLIRLTDNVVLTRGKNVLKGDHLIYNLESGQSQLIGGGTERLPSSAPGKPATTKRARVHALFVPGGDDGDNGQKKDKK